MTFPNPVSFSLFLSKCCYRFLLHLHCALPQCIRVTFVFTFNTLCFCMTLFLLLMPWYQGRSTVYMLEGDISSVCLLEKGLLSLFWWCWQIIVVFFYFFVALFTITQSPLSGFGSILQIRLNVVFNLLVLGSPFVSSWKPWGEQGSWHSLGYHLFPCPDHCFPGAGPLFKMWLTPSVDLYQMNCLSLIIILYS